MATKTEDTNWSLIKAEYVTTKTTYSKLSEKYGVSLKQIYRVSSSEKWVESRKKYVQSVSTKAINKTANKTASQIAKINELSDRLIVKIEQAIDELDLTMATNTHKNKVIEYNNKDRPDKPTKEIIDETEEIVACKTIIDRLGLNKITSALKDIKEIQMIRSELDREEQEARIARLRSQTSSDGNDKDDGIASLR